MSSVEKRMAIGAAWMVSLRMFLRSIGLLSTIILARILVPEDFGLIALAFSVVATLEVLGDFSVEWALIRHKETSRPLYDSAWSLNLVRGLIVSSVLLIGAPWFASFYGDDRLEAIFFALALNSLILELKNVGIVEFKKELNFKKEFQIQAIRKISGFTVTISLAYYLQNYWALVAGTLSSSIVFLLLSFAMHPYRPRVSFSRAYELLSFSVWLFLSSAVNAIVRQGIFLLLGRYETKSNIGIFTLGKEVGELPTTELVWPIATALYPGYSKFVDQPEELNRIYLSSYQFIFMLAAPVGVGLAICAPWLVPLMLGEKWLDTIPIIQVFSIAGVIRMLSVGAGSIFLTLNRLRLQFILTLTALSVSIPVVAYLVKNNGILGASMGMLLLVSISSALQMVAIYRLLNIPWHYGIKYIYRPLVSVSVMVVLLQFLKVELLPDPITNLEIITQLIMVVFSGAFVYVSTLIIMWKLSGSPESSERVVLSHIYKFTKRYMGNVKIGR